MYCIKCGVELADSEKVCPLCNTTVYHPELAREAGESPYPLYRPTPKRMNKSIVLLLISVFLLVLAVQLVVFDLRFSPGLSWSYYASGGILLLYTAVVLPMWFDRPNPVIFLPVSFAVAAGYLFGVDRLLSGGWFMPFALPLLGGAALISTAVVTLVRYLKRGHFYIFGGATIALGVYFGMLEVLIYQNFFSDKFYFWSFYPLAGCTLLGIFLIIVGIVPPLRGMLDKKFFI